MNALVRVLLQTPAEQASKRRIEFIAVSLRRLDRVIVQDCARDLAGGFSSKRWLTREHLVEDRAEVEEVGTVVYHSAPELLGSHVTGRAGSARDKVFRGLRRGVGDGYVRHCKFGQTEVEDLDTAVASEEEIFGF